MTHAEAPVRDWVQERREVIEAREGLTRLRWWYLANAILTLVPVALLGTVVWEEAAHGGVSPTLVGLTAVVMLQLAGMVLACLRVAANPRFWTIIIAVCWTINLGVNLFGELAWLRLGLAAFCALCAWLFVPSAKRLRAQLAAHPGLHEPHPAHRGAGAGTEELHRLRARVAAEHRRVLKRDLIIGAAVVLAFGVTMVGLWRTRRPPPFDVQGEFVAAWNQSSVDAVAALAGEEYRDKLASFLRRSVAKRAWNDGWPHITTPELEWGTDTVKAKYAIDLGEMQVWFELQRRTWVLKAVSLPNRE